MSTYTLTAALDTRKSRVQIHADNSLEATINAIGEVMNRAYKDQTGPWALGSIDLTDSQGNVLHHMDAK